MYRWNRCRWLGPPFQRKLLVGRDNEIATWTRHQRSSCRLHAICYRYKDMRDADIRQVLRERLKSYLGANGASTIIEELGLCGGTVRVDIAVVNGSLKGYEIKSAKDTLTRLSAQAEAYSRVFETMTVVVAERHLRAAEALIPCWWGIQIAAVRGSSTQLTIEDVRGERDNPSVDAGSLVQLLWRNEVVELLDEIRELRSLRNKPRRILWDTLVAAVPMAELKGMVCNRLRTRPHWRVDTRKRQGGGTCQLSATSSGSPLGRALPHSRQYIDRPN